MQIRKQIQTADLLFDLRRVEFLACVCAGHCLGEKSAVRVNQTSAKLSADTFNHPRTFPATVHFQASGESSVHLFDAGVAVAVE